ATVGTWTGGAGNFTPNANTLNATYTPNAADSTAGVVTLTLTTDNPVGVCNAVSDQMIITINQPAIVNANADQAICYGSTVTLAGTMGGSATVVTWTGGAGTFTPDTKTLNSTY